jgi:hypothetical protein
VLDYEVWQTRPIEDELQAKYTDLLRRVKEVALEIEEMPIHQLDFKQIAVNLYGDKREKSMKNKILATLHDHIQELED